MRDLDKATVFSAYAREKLIMACRSALIWIESNTTGIGGLLIASQLRDAIETAGGYVPPLMAPKKGPC